MIQKRYEYFSREGKQWSEWFNYERDDSKLEKIKKEFYWQLPNKLKNDFRIA